MGLDTRRLDSDLDILAVWSASLVIHSKQNIKSELASCRLSTFCPISVASNAVFESYLVTNPKNRIEAWINFMVHVCLEYLNIGKDFLMKDLKL